MNRVANMLGEKAGDMVEGAVKSALGVKDKDKDKKKGGIFSSFGGDKKKEKEKEKGGIFSFGHDKKKENEKGGFFSKIFDKDDDGEKEINKKSGFTGLFSEQEGARAAEGNEEDAEGGGEESEGNEAQSVELNDGDLFNDLMDVAQETSKGN